MCRESSAEGSSDGEASLVDVKEDDSGATFSRRDVASSSRMKVSEKTTSYLDGLSTENSIRLGGWRSPEERQADHRGH